MNRIAQGIVIAGALLATLGRSWAVETPLRLENPLIALEIDRVNGAILSVRDEKLDVVYPQKGIGFEVTTGKSIFRAKKAATIRTEVGQLEMGFSGSGLNVILHYRLGAKDHFIEKWLEIRPLDEKPHSLQSVVLEDKTSETFSDFHFHHDNTIWHCPINLFLRSSKGGCFAGIEYPYWNLKQRGKEGFILGYQPNYHATVNEVNVSEKYFIGIYRKEGIQRTSQEPYPGRGHYPLISKFGGLSQHFKGSIPNPIMDVPLETLDWGEV